MSSTGPRDHVYRDAVAAVLAPDADRRAICVERPGSTMPIAGMAAGVAAVDEGAGRSGELVHVIRHGDAGVPRRKG